MRKMSTIPQSPGRVLVTVSTELSRLLLIT